MTPVGPFPSPPGSTPRVVRAGHADDIGRRLAGLAIGLGLLVLSLRTVGPAALIVTASVGVVGLLIPSEALGNGGRDALPVRLWPVPAAVALGVAAFGAVRLLALPAPPGPTLWPAVAGTIAALAEEAFFRRLAYGWLERWGAMVAVLGAALLFAAVHVPAYGAAAFPIDLGAGLVFGWQRWATGGWAAPAATHVAANLIQLW